MNIKIPAWFTLKIRSLLHCIQRSRQPPNPLSVKRNRWPNYWLLTGSSIYRVFYILRSNILQWIRYSLSGHALFFRGRVATGNKTVSIHQPGHFTIVEDCKGNRDWCHISNNSRFLLFTHDVPHHCFRQHKYDYNFWFPYNFLDVFPCWKCPHNC